MCLLLFASNLYLFVSGFLTAPRTELLELNLSLHYLLILAGIVITPITASALETN